MRSTFFPRLLNGPEGDPVMYVRLAHRGEALLFDCGELHQLGTRELLKIKAVFVSHAHIDHMVGFDSLLRGFLHQDRTLLIYGPAGLAGQIGSRLAGYTWNLVDGYPLVLTVREWEDGPGRELTFRAGNRFRAEREREWSGEGDLLLSSDDLQVRAVALDHGGITSLGFALQEPLHVAIHKDALEAQGYLPGPWLTRFKDLLRQNADPGSELAVPLRGGGLRSLPLELLQEQLAHTERGMKVVYVTDAAPSDANQGRIAALAQDAHLLVIEAVFPHDELQRARERNHLTARLAGEIARKAAVARLLTFHHSPRYHDHPGLLASEAEAAFRGQL